MGTIANAGAAGHVHGPWGNNVRDVSSTFSITNGVTQCTISWRSWKFRSRDNEVDQVFVGNDMVWQDHVPASCTSGWLEASGANAYTGQTGSICFQDVSVNTPCSGSTTVRFHSEIDEVLSNEGWAFRYRNKRTRSSAEHGRVKKAQETGHT